MRIIRHTLTALAVSLIALPAVAAENVKIAWTHYTGWELWGDIAASGLANKHIAQTCGAGSSVEIDMLNDYIGSINLYTGGEYDGVTATNMDALTIPAVGGVKSEMLIVGDTSYGNDALITNDPSVKSVKDLKGKTVYLVELSVSHYMLARALDMNGMSEKDIEVINVSDADIGAIFLSTPDTTIVTWNPIAMQVTQADPKANVLFTSSGIEGEIIDALVVKANMADCAKQALRGAWFEAMAKLKDGDKDLIEALAKQSGAKTASEFTAQMKTTQFFWTADEADAFVKSSNLKETMDWVRRFSFDHGLYNGKGVDDVGIAFPDKFVMGNRKNINMIWSAQK